MPRPPIRWIPLALVGSLIVLAGCPGEEPLVTTQAKASPSSAPGATPSPSSSASGNLLDRLLATPSPTPSPTLAPLQPPVTVSAEPATPAPTASYEPQEGDGL